MKFGIIYKITCPHWNSERCYIGRTEETKEKRLKSHIRDAKKTKQSKKDGDGKLHKMMGGVPPEDIKIEEIDSAKTEEELKKLEIKYIEKYDAVKKGLNKVKGARYLTPRNEAISVIIEGKEIKAVSKNALCRKLEIKSTTVNYWQTEKAKTFQEAVDKAIDAKNKTRAKKGSIKAFRRTYDTYNELAIDISKNKYGYTGRELSQKHKNDSKKKLEEILKTPKKENKKKIKFNLPDGSVKEFDSRALALDAWSELAKAFGLSALKKKPPRSTVDILITKGQKPEQAFGLTDRPWKEELIKRGIYKLIDDKGYKLTGVLSGVGIPVVDHEKEEIFSTEKEFAKAYNYDYTTTSAKIKKGSTAEEIRKKHGD